jgi:hypothetical protein
MNKIKVTRDREEEDKKGWDQLHKDLKDPTLWEKSEGKDLDQVIEAVAPLKKGRPKSEVPTKGVFVKLPLELIDELKTEARLLNIGYQSILKIAITEHLRTKKEERERAKKAKY